MQLIRHTTKSGVAIEYQPYPRERLERQITFTEITQADLARIANYREPFLSRVPAMVDAFYAHLWTIPELRAVVERFSTVDRLKMTLIEYLNWLVQGRIDQEYADFRYRVGAVHEKIALAPQWYLGMFHVFEEQIMTLIYETTPDGEAAAHAVLSFLKLLSLDMQLAMDAYIHAYVAERTKRMGKLQDLRQKLAGSSQDLAASAEESSAAAEEMAAATGHVAADATQVAEQVQAILRSAEEGVRRMKQVADTIRQVSQRMASLEEKVTGLTDSSRRMESILKTVDGIAKQTNMLSLNAAIEAARAGQHGRGFAVVADEVRKLSNRTAASLKEIADLVATSNAHVGAVSETATNTGKLAAVGATEVGLAEQELNEISRLVANGAAAITAINRAVQELAQMATDVQAGAERNARLASDLSTLAVDVE